MDACWIKGFTLFIERMYATDRFERRVISIGPDDLFVARDFEKVR